MSYRALPMLTLTANPDDSALDDQTELAKNGLTASATWPATRPTNNATEHASSATSNFATTATTNTTTQTALQTRFATFLGRRKPIPLVTAQAQDGVAGASSHSVDGRAGSVIVPLPSPPATAALPPSPAISGSSFADHEPGNTSGAPKRDAASDVVAQERSLRYAAQVALSQTQAQLTGSQRELGTVQAELEDLTATLFTQANSMVADERKARARLEDRLTLLETRDRDRGKRLDSLERAVGLVERIRLLVDDG